MMTKNRWFGLAALLAIDLILMYDAYPDLSSRTCILQVLSDIGPKANEAVPVVLRGMTNTFESVRLNATTALGKIHANAAQSIPALIVGLKDPNTVIRRRAIAGLGEFGQKARPAVPALLQLLREEKYDPITAPAPSQFLSTGLESIFGGFSGTNIVIPTSAVRLPLAPGNGPADLAASALWKIDTNAAVLAQLKKPE